MASTTALFTGLSGLSTNARRLDVIGNNIANLNTNGYKSSRILFSPTFSRNLSAGTAPGDVTGGTNPTQIGLGAKIAGTQRNFANGSISTTGVTSDAAIEGEGFFIVNNGGTQMFTRSGAFQLNERNELVTVSGARVQGFGIDENFNIVQGQLNDLTIPVGTLTVAEATTEVTFNGNLNASGVVATTGSTHSSSAFYTDAGLTSPLNTDTFDLTVPGNDLYISDGAGGSFLALDGNDPGPVITIDGVEKGGQSIGEKKFQFSTGAPTGDIDATGQTIADFIAWMEQAMGLDDSTVNGQTLGGGIQLNTTTGEIEITGNEGTVQNLDISTADITVSNNGAGISQPFVMSKTGEADGESVRTSFVTFDSLGTPVTVDLSMVLQETTPGGGTTWQYIAESNDSAASSRIVGLGTMEFDSNGDFVEASSDSFSVVRDNGATTPLTVQMNFDQGSDSISALTDTSSSLAAVFQDGSPIGTLNSFAIGDDGVISGAFTNGLTRDIGQIALANFANPEGLVDVGNNLFQGGANSGEALITTPGQFGTGRMIGGALELSNVDLSREFTDMILASTGYSAASRVITTTDELIDRLLILGQ